MSKRVAVSGGFDPLHDGHVRMIQAAAKFGGVEVYLNSDDWLTRKKGYVFLPFAARAEILLSLRGVVRVIPADDDDGTVCKTLDRYCPDYFCNGGDRTAVNTPEVELCNRLGIDLLWGCGGNNGRSSSWLVRKRINRPWGYFETLDEGADYWVKVLTIQPGQRTSLQAHKHRQERFIQLAGMPRIQGGGAGAEWVLPGEKHRVLNIGDRPAKLLEIAKGVCEEADIERFEDDYGRADDA